MGTKGGQEKQGGPGIQRGEWTGMEVQTLRVPRPRQAGGVVQKVRQGPMR